MSKKMLIDATHSEETRVVVLENGRVEELDVDTSTKKQIKGNIYLARIVRVEPSLQAAFVDYGGNKHGFLAFGEIHPDYYQIPVADREALKEMIEAKSDEDNMEKDDVTISNDDSDVEEIGDTETEETPRQQTYFYKKYKIQEVIRQGQVMLVQVVKEERGNKGAALTTYLSLAGRFSVLMPNNGRGGGVSRKITNVKDRKTLRAIVDKLPIPDGMSVIIRTAGQGKTKTEIKRDYDYLIKTWMKIRENTLESLAPTLIHEEGDIIKRSLRDVFSPDIEEIWVEGESVFKSTKDFMKLLMPSQAKKVKQYKGTDPLFLTHQIEGQLESIHSNIVQLKSGGYLVIDQTEALVAVDVNSGRATREHDIEETALRTNLETCDELARQLRLRDMAGLIVIDFIDMDEQKNNAAVERRLKEALKRDRARIQVGKMSGFGLMEMSRQRLHSSFLESSYHVCPHCGGKGMTRSVESCAMHALHILEDSCVKNKETELILSLPLAVATYLLNNKRNNVVALEKKYDAVIRVLADSTLDKESDFKLEKIRHDGERVNISNTCHQKQSEKEKKVKESEKSDKNEKKAEKREKEKNKTTNATATVLEETISENSVEVVVETSVEEPEQQEQTQTISNRKSRNNRRRNEWRKKRRERRLQRLAEMEEQSGNEGLEENFKVVEQQGIEEFNTTHVEEPIQNHNDVVSDVENVEQPKNGKQKVKKHKSFKSRHAAKMKREAELAKENEVTTVIEEAKPATPKKKVSRNSENQELTTTVAKTESVVQQTAETNSDENADKEPKRKKRGWWNKLVNSEE